MTNQSLNNNINRDEAIRLSDHIWWVGHVLEDDKFQCHVYLIENGTESVLVDPGSKLTFKYVLKKVETIVPFNHIRYFICQHQDPDITGSLGLIDQLVTRDDAMIISHWRAIALLKHYALDLPMWCVEKNNWQLTLSEGRKLEFIFTPYLHFPGAFCTFDRQSGILFSSDIFGAFVESSSLFADDESYFEGMKFFHEHYMPSREILFSGLCRLEAHPVKMIAPQHGFIIPEPMVNFYFNQLKNIDCGLFMMAETNTDIIHLSKLNRILRESMETMILYRSFSDIGRSLLELIQKILPVETFECYAMNESKKILHISEENMFRGVEADLPEKFKGLMGMDKLAWEKKYGNKLVIEPYDSADKTLETEKKQSAILPLISSENKKIHGMAIIRFSDQLMLDNETSRTLMQIATPLNVAVEREMIQRSMEIEKQKFYEQAIKDPLTGLYTRVYMNEAVSRLFSLQDRNPSTDIAVIMFDIDLFKRINDTYGHNEGDTVLKSISGIILDAVRESDIPVRIGGEEFAVFIAGEDAKQAVHIAERVSSRISQLQLPSPLDKERFSISAGVAFRTCGQSIKQVLYQADMALYEAKQTGRNKVIVSKT